uniref:Uncharacterized protein n=1 Tax=Lepeophtheirus salmonis TaxID=72036 RepID=A0A0K2VEG5_LEPSM
MCGGNIKIRLQFLDETVKNAI